MRLLITDPKPVNGETRVDDLTQPPAKDAPRMNLDRRKRLLKAVRQELATREKQTGPISRVIYAHRADRGDSPTAAAVRATAVLRVLQADSPEITEADVRALERGTVDFSDDAIRVRAAVVAATQGVARETAQSAYGRALQPATGTGIAAARHMPIDTSNANKILVEQFMSFFDQARAESGGVNGA